MKNLRTLDREGFLDVLAHLSRDWTASVEDRCIHLRRGADAEIYSPITAVYRHLTDVYVHRGSFWHSDICERFGIPWWEMLEITYAETACNGNGRGYDQEFRNRMLVALGLTPEKLFRY